MKTILALILFLFSVPSQADDWYAGAGVGLANDEMANTIIAGYDINKRWSVETRYTYFGETNNRRYGTTSNDTHTYTYLENVSVKSNALALSVLSKLPLLVDDGLNVSLVGRAGLSHWKSSSTIRTISTVVKNAPPYNFVSTDSSVEDKESGVAPVLAVGLNIKLENTVSFRLEYSIHKINDEAVSGLTAAVLVVF